MADTDTTGEKKNLPAKHTGHEAEVEQIGATTLESQLAYAAQLAKSGLIPEAFQKHPENVLVAIEWGREIGLSPIAAMKEIYVVHGTPSLSSKSMLMLTRKAGHRVRVTGDDQKATCEIVRADDPEYPHKITFTLDDAKHAGLMGNTGWKNSPTTMLRWRAVANCVRLACPEVLGGIAYTPEEIEENSRRNSRRTIVTQVPAQQVKDAAHYMRALGLTGHDFKAFAERILGPGITGWEQLTHDQQELVLAALADWEQTGADPTTGEIVDADTDEEDLA